MFKIPVNLSVLFKRLLIVLLLYTLTRFLFYWFNYDYFKDASFFSTLKLFFYGLRFDICAISITNLLFIILHLFPIKLFYSKGYQLLIKFLFYLVNVASIIFNAIDFIYFKFTNKRTTADFFKLFGLGEDMGNTIPRIVADFWYVLLMVIILFIIAGWLYNRVRIKQPLPSSNLLVGWLYSVPVIIITVFASRGGIQYVPINILSASGYATPQFTPLVLNTPFTIIKTLGKSELSVRNYYSDEDVEKKFPVSRNYKKETPFKPYNVVLIIMESFSKEYIGSLNHNEGFTPFLDSLIKQSLVFTNAFANGKKSMEGIPAVLAGMPQLMSNPYITSAYNGDELITFASLLKKKKYSGWFFHGGINGTMGFDRFTKMGGFDHYIGRNEYPDKSDFDGNWGIYDEPFFNYFANTMDQVPTPFVAGIFSVSSHHPYSIPDSLKGKFRKGPLPILESVMYADQSLGRFFATASKKSWFNNTLFVITADHTGPSTHPFYQSKAGMYAVPVIFYMPGKIAPAISGITCQQADILPSVMDFMGYDLPFNAFGSSVFDSTSSHCAFNYMDDIYQLMQDNYLLQFDGTQPTGLFYYPNDSILGVNLIQTNNEITEKHTATLKAIIQQYNNRLINNRIAR